MSQRNVRAKAVIGAAALAAIGFCNSANATVILSSIYGDGGFSASGSFPAAYFANDYIQLYNNGPTATTLGGLYLEVGTYATEPVGNNSFEILQLPATATIGASGYYLIQVPDYNGTKASNFHSSPGQYSSPAADLVVYSSSAAGTPVFDAPYFANGKLALVSGDSTAGQFVDYVGYGTGLGSGSYAPAGTNATNYYNNYATYPGFFAPASEGSTGYAGAGFSSTGAYTGAALGETGALVRTNTADAYDPTQSAATGFGLDNNADWTYETTFTLTNSSGASVTAGPVPEPATVGLLAVGAATLVARRRNRK